MTYANKKCAVQALKKAINEIKKIEMGYGGWISDYKYFPTTYNVFYFDKNGNRIVISKDILKN